MRKANHTANKKLAADTGAHNPKNYSHVIVHYAPIV